MIDAVTAEAIKAHAVASYPNEACGVVMKDGRFVPLANVADEPTSTFRMPTAEYARLLPEATVIAHSHPDGPDCPSAADMRAQIETGLPWAIVSCNDEGALDPFLFGDQVPVPDLIGRGFRHGVTDCYSLIRDWYRVERRITLPEFPRDWEWWHQGEDLYRDGFEAAGFRQVSMDDAREGDVFLIAIRSGIPNHGGVYTGKGLGLHHLTGQSPVDPSRVSRREPVARWRHHITHWLRHDAA